MQVPVTPRPDPVAMPEGRWWCRACGRPEVFDGGRWLRGVRLDAGRGGGRSARRRRGAVITVPADEMARLLTALRDEYQGSVDALLAAARRGTATWSSRRRLPEPVPLRGAGEVLEAVRLRLVTREEARRLLGLRARPSTRTARPDAVSPAAKAIGEVLTGGVSR